MIPLLRDPNHWRSRAQEARDLAEKIADHESKLRMLHIADEYDKLAKRAEMRVKTPPQSK
jgi:hypothetical protein